MVIIIFSTDAFARRECSLQTLPSRREEVSSNCDMHQRLVWDYPRWLYTSPLTDSNSVVWSSCEIISRGHSLFRFCWTCRCMPLHHVVTCPMQAPGKFFLDILLSSQPNYGNWPAWWCPTHQSLSLCQMWFLMRSPVWSHHTIWCFRRFY